MNGNGAIITSAYTSDVSMTIHIADSPLWQTLEVSANTSTEVSSEHYYWLANGA